MALDFEIIKKEALEAIEKAGDLAYLEETFKKYLGKKGKIAEAFESFGDLALEEKKELGIKINQIKKELENIYFQKERELKDILIKQKVGQGSADILLPGIKPEIGHLHPITKVKREAEEIFKSMGFEIAQGPEVETEWYNFDALNIPDWHPARDMWDTFWLRQSELKMKNEKIKTEGKLLLRTHTSPVQIRYMEKHQPPIKIIAPGRVFRYEATDASHEMQFYQIEGLMVAENISVANFKAIIQAFFQKFFDDKNIKIRLRPSYFPFTEPSFEIDVSKPDGTWMELAGAGMVHPSVLKAGKIDANKYTGFAFGMGLDRLAMIKYKINDIRLFYQNDLRFLNQF
ncbi:MAG: phenylalanine--tRNA ligase subunit alpha [Candidatus Gribaldobacteria bacterium]|nr:phenylalanine--tRNA ligase subunit alpha [Candidatus Gribaldobacteria bacterium]